MAELKKREDQRLEDTWDLTPIFESDDQWDEAFSKLESRLGEERPFKENGIQDAEDLKAALELEREIGEEFGQLFVYAHLKHDQDASNPTYNRMEDRARNLGTKLASHWSFLLPMLMTVDESQLTKWAEQDQLKEFKFDIEKLNKKRKHVLSEKEEQLLAEAGEVLNNPTSTFMMFNNADLEFEDAVDKEGKAHAVTHGTYIDLLKSNDRVLRKSAYESLYRQYGQYENTLSQMLSGEIDTHIFTSQTRGYESSRDQALSNNHIPETVYDQLVDVVNDHLHLLHRYTELRKEILQLDELKMYDMYTPLIDVDFKVTYKEGQEFVLNALAPLGKEYQSILKEAFNNRWIDVYENKGKRSGAYSSGTYGTNPYILMNWQDNVNHVFTLAHELGHSVHSYYSRKNQPSNQSGYSIFVAEVASTFNESLLSDYMYKHIEDDTKKLYLLNEQLEGFRGTVFRQTMFAEFEHKIHTLKEQGEPLTAEKLNEVYARLNKKYFGESVIYDDMIEKEWARIPHFYMNYYVYQYATGYAAAASLSEQVLNGGEEVRDRYINEFLKKGASNYPIEILKNAGVDMTTRKPIENAMKFFEEKLNQFESLLKNK